MVLVSLALLAFAVAYIWPGNVTKYPPGILVGDDPEQTLIANGESWEVKGYRITPLADYRIRARVVMTDRYWLGRESDLSPLDLSVVWQSMSDQTILDQISFTRERRAWSYRPKGRDWPIPLPEVVSHSANMHMIPANSEIDGQLKAVSSGDIVDMAGYLVEVTATDGFRWRSSLSRTDDGPHACELMWVTHVGRAGK